MAIPARVVMFWMMIRHDKTLKALALTWKKAGPKLRAMRHADIRRQNNAHAIDALNDLFRQTIAKHVPPKTSGFVEMYKTLRRQSNG